MAGLPPLAITPMMIDDTGTLSASAPLLIYAPLFFIPVDIADLQLPLPMER